MSPQKLAPGDRRIPCEYFCRVYFDDSQRLPYRIELRVYYTRPMPKGATSYPVDDILLHVTHAGGYGRARRKVKRLIRKGPEYFKQADEKPTTVSEFHYTSGDAFSPPELRAWTSDDPVHYEGPWYS